MASVTLVSDCSLDSDELGGWAIAGSYFSDSGSESGRGSDTLSVPTKVYDRVPGTVGCSFDIVRGGVIHHYPRYANLHRLR